MKPRAVEQAVQGEIAGVSVRGIVDLLDVDGCVFYFKSSSKRPTGISAEHSLQLRTYAMITQKHAPDFVCVLWRDSEVADLGGRLP
jgi:hypothetical protein